MRFRLCGKLGIWRLLYKSDASIWRIESENQSIELHVISFITIVWSAPPRIGAVSLAQRFNALLLLLHGMALHIFSLRHSRARIRHRRQPYPLRFERGENFLKVLIVHHAGQNFSQH